MEQKCATSSQAAHDGLVSANRDRRPLLGVNIVGQLEREFSGRTDELRKFIHDLVREAGNFLEFDPQTVVLGAAKARVSQCLVILPKAGDLAGFSDDLKALFRDNFRGDVPVEFIESDTKPNEITLRGLTNLFPVRTRLGKTLPKVAEGIDLTAAQHLEDAAQAQLASAGYQHLDRRTEVQAGVREELSRILTERRGDFEDPIYRRIETAAHSAIQDLKKI
ncbi:hypothetical protein [uncultured Thiodictyon sp.]|uniref:hypothetical protein n=1 Tax=uncultured Thiodictyon sp. TaxID=1846217 RepID=UPI0025D2D2A9|nr:hypothetical protein [uncultured Thiodictyon sp.]